MSNARSNRREVKIGFPKNSKELFKERSIILFGNFKQLPPVLDIPMFSKCTSLDRNSNKEKLGSLKRPVIKILAVHTSGNEAKKASSNVAKRLESQLLLAKEACVMLIANL
ncbi:hypothetical protein RhiirA4_465892 [Rhizophagus irregularis]|uniref:Uncharacterized protein n=1 Tax=Rhizophagus irregularis TaxID=588596 RepID=A0A2I1GT50_9GLOM|nr:hypothetical protein RhiirA4_465892 [Rhizophagus irregularis]